MNPPNSVLALDVGGRRIGVAMASLEARIAQPLLTIDRQNVTDLFALIKELIKEHNVGVIIVGLPRGLEGQETTQTIASRDFARELAEECNIEVFLQDEAATSLAAKEDLNAVGKPYDKADIDKIAAAYILRDWLATTEGKL